MLSPRDLDGQRAGENFMHIFTHISHHSSGMKNAHTGKLLPSRRLHASGALEYYVSCGCIQPWLNLIKLFVIKDYYVYAIKHFLAGSPEQSFLTEYLQGDLGRY